MGFEVLIILGVIAAIAIGVTKSRNRQINRSWNSVARMLDLSRKDAAFGSAPQLSGFVEGHDLTVDIDKKRVGKNRSAWTRFRLGMQPLELGLMLKSEGFLDGVRKAFGAQDIQVGNAAFDEAVLVVGNDEAVMREYLTPERRRTILRFLSSYKGAVITDDEISFSSRGYLRDASQITGTIESMLLVAQSLTEVRDDAEPAGLEPRRPPPERLREPDTGPEKLISEEAAIAEADTPTDSEIAAVSAPADSPAIAEFCEAVFAPGTLSFDTTKTFKKGFEGKRVVWSGTLESATPYTVDFDFGSTGGVRAVLKIDTKESGPTGIRDVKAVIGLPVATEGLDGRIGQRMAFAGTLHKVEGFARKVFLADAEVVG